MNRVSRRVTCFGLLRVDNRRRKDHDWRLRNIGRHGAATSGGYGSHLVDDVHPLNYFTEDSIAVALGCLTLEIQETIVHIVDEKLRRSGLWVGGSGHCNCAAIIQKTIVRFVFDRGLGAFLIPFLSESTTLCHEVLNDAVKDGAVVETILHVTEEVGSGHRGLFSVELDHDIAEAGVQLNFRCGGGHRCFLRWFGRGKGIKPEGENRCQEEGENGFHGAKGV